jgi:ATP phosphoribosyltransferase
MTARIAVPSRGRLRDVVVGLLEEAGFSVGALGGTGARVVVDGLEFIEMRPRDAAGWLAAGRIDGGFISTDLVLEEGLAGLSSLALGSARSDLVVASRSDDGRASARDLEGAVVATHLPHATAQWFAEQELHVKIVTMGGSLEGVCASGLADAIVDLRETGNSLSQNGLRALATITPCQGLYVYNDGPEFKEFLLRLQAVLDARKHRYVMLHLDPAMVGSLSEIFPGLAAPTVLPLAGRDDLVAVHFVIDAASFWNRLHDLHQLGASAVVALSTDALVR